jgi:hypothetical protein
MALGDERHLAFNNIESSDRDTSRINVRNIPKKTRARIAELARTPKWGPEEIFDQMSTEGHNVNLDEIYAVTRRG